MPDDYDVWRKRAPLLAKMSFDEIAERGLVFVGSADTVTRQIRAHVECLDVLALACVFKFGGMPLRLTLDNMRRFAREVRPRLGPRPGRRPRPELGLDFGALVRG